MFVSEYQKYTKPSMFVGDPARDISFGLLTLGDTSTPKCPMPILNEELEYLIEPPPKKSPMRQITMTEEPQSRKEYILRPGKKKEGTRGENERDGGKQSPSH